MSKTIIKVSVNDQELALITRPVVSSGGENENVIQFYFDEIWKGYQKEAFFKKEGIDPIKTVVVDGVASVPNEMTAENGEFQFGVIGYKDIEKTTELISFAVVDGAIVDSNADLIPTPSVHAQIIQLSTDAIKIAEETRKEFNSGVVPAIRDQNTMAAVRVWTGGVEEYTENENSLPEGTLAIIDDQYAEYLVSQTDAITKYSGGTAEAVFRVTSPNVPVNQKEGEIYTSPAFSIPFPDYITEEPYSCNVSIVKTGSEDFFSLLAVSGSWDSEKTQKMKVISFVLNDSVSITIEVRTRFKWAGE